MWWIEAGKASWGKQKTGNQEGRTAGREKFKKDKYYFMGLVLLILYFSIENSRFLFIVTDLWLFNMLFIEIWNYFSVCFHFDCWLGLVLCFFQFKTHFEINNFFVINFMAFRIGNWFWSRGTFKMYTDLNQGSSTTWLVRKDIPDESSIHYYRSFSAHIN